MAFIVKKKIGNKEYYYLRESKRVGKKVIAKTIAYLGKDIEEAKRKAKDIEEAKRKAKDIEGKSLKREEKIIEGKMKNKNEVKELSIDDNNKSQSMLSIEELAAFCKRKGFVYPSGEIYGGLAGFWDYGHLGVEVFNNIKQEWWRFHVQSREDVEGIDGAIITNPKVWEASGHVESFLDVEVVNKKTGERKKVDKHEVDSLDKDWEVKGEFNPMFVTKVGPSDEKNSPLSLRENSPSHGVRDTKGLALENSPSHGVRDDEGKAYLRPETAQLIFVNFKNIWDNARLKLPCGIAQIGKAFRNEISPREFLFRAREFEQMELEYFIASGQKCPYIDEIKGIEIEIYDEKMQKSGEKNGKKMEILEALKKGLIKTDWHAYWLAEEMRWFILLGANIDKFRARQHTFEEKSHYASDTWDLEYKFPMGWRELQGFANRGTWDLGRHSQFSGKSMEVNDSNFGKVLPEVVCEPSLGVGRAFLVFMLDAYNYDSKRENVVLRLSGKLAPYKAAVFPIMSKGEVYEMSREVFKDLKEEFNVFFDKSGSIGRRYSRQDEIGTPYCITIDGDSLKKKDVTIRDRDSTKQIRVKIKDLREVLRDLLDERILFDDAGKLVETRVK